MKPIGYHLSAVVLLALTPRGLAQRAEFPYRTLEYSIHSGFHVGQGADVTVAYEEVIRVPDATWLQLLFVDYDFGQNSFVTFLSLGDEGYQILDATSMPQWNLGSAFFNGDAVLLAREIAPPET